MAVNAAKLNKRQDKILEILDKKGKVSISQALEELRLSFGEISKVTINRDLAKLLDMGFIARYGKARAIFYELSPQYNLLKRIDQEKYFLTDTDKRAAKENFNFEIFSISISKIEDLHYLLTKDLGISRNLRKTAVGITGTKYKPLNNEFQIKEALKKSCDLSNKEDDLFSKAVILMILIAYIQPFEDGNKRTSRLAGNAILMARNICPLSYRNVNEMEYKKAVILFYEQNNINYFKKLFIEQFEFAVKNYFRIN
jgi:Fic family protein